MQRFMSVGNCLSILQSLMLYRYIIAPNVAVDIAESMEEYTTFSTKYAPRPRGGGSKLVNLTKLSVAVTKRAATRVGRIVIKKCMKRNNVKLFGTRHLEHGLREYRKARDNTGRTEVEEEYGRT